MMLRTSPDVTHSARIPTQIAENSANRYNARAKSFSLALDRFLDAEAATNVANRDRTETAHDPMAEPASRANT